MHWKKTIPTVLAVLACCMSTGFSQGNIVRIEEDWELKVSQPEPQLDAPQVTTTMVPFAAAPDLLLQVDLNHGTYPSFTDGGFQVRSSIGDECLNDARSLQNERLSEDAETVRWTQVVQQTPGGFLFGVTAGTSESWGEFGGPGSFIFIDDYDAGNSLSAYTSQESIDNSGVTYAANRVSWLRLKKVRLYTATGLLSETTVNVDAQ